jgi:hypothetical protein
MARRFDLSSGILSGGISALYGRHLPRFSSLLDPLMDEAFKDMPLSYSVILTNKVRIGFDAEYTRQKDLLRGELVVGSDSDGPVNGQFFQWNHNLSEKDEVTAQVARWDQPSGTRVRVGGWYGHKFGRYTTIRMWSERSHGRIAADISGNETAGGLQCLIEIQRLIGR